MKIFDNQFSHAVSAGSPHQDTKIPFDWERGFDTISPSEPVFFTESHYPLSKQLSHSNKVLWILESPFMVDNRLTQDISDNATGFKKILTHDDRLVGLDNSIIFPVGGCWIQGEDIKLHPKTKLISMIASPKQFTDGQRMRHQVASTNTVEVYGQNYKPLTNKADALRDYSFHVCIENTKHKHYFTEKIIDCFATGAIPIYWGASEISQYFNTEGIIEVDDFEEMMYAVSNIHHFKVNQEAVRENFEICKEYFTPEQRILSIFG